ncbi:Flp family type IVb pilin [Agromyces mangrovi Wang et al. 2018]|uniref:Flp family type IVb pilin n=1 Tax=Agromyces mangrovi TaxID=1858653 RepID=UPI002574511B|nr:hypothetical protein [Agromyces mangrovi]BDZ65035.1 hypothetical protein GCM10025877_19730 [Agromyces mangrovi]
MLKLFATLHVLRSVVRDEERGNAAEYALVLGLVALGIIVGLGGLALALNTFFINAAAEIPNDEYPHKWGVLVVSMRP